MSEELGILEDTSYGRTITICVDEHEQNSIWNMYSDHGRKKRGMKKCKVIIKEI